MRIKKLTSIFDLLESEKSRIISTYEKLIQFKYPSETTLMSANTMQNTRPLLTWKL